MIERLTTSKQQEIDDALMKCLVGKVLPLSLVENPYFRDFVSLSNKKYEMPSRRNIVSKLEKKKSQMEAKMKSDLKFVENMAITHDGWISINTESFSTVTVHYINDKWELKSVVLETKKVSGSHTAENIKGSLLNTQQHWGLPTPIGVTDNAANERKAFDLLNWTRFGCYGHRLNLVVKGALALPEMAKIVAKGGKLVTFFHQSSSVSDLLMLKQSVLLPQEMVGHKLLADVPTRWNSTYFMLERLLEQTAPLVAVVNDPECSKSAAATIKSYLYSFEEQTLIEQLVNLLLPFLKATESVCAYKYPTLHKIMLIILKLSKSTEVHADDPKGIRDIKQKMKEQLDSRTKDRDLALMACMLNPFTKQLDFLSMEERLDGYAKLLREALGVSEKVQVKQEPGTHEESLPALPTLPALPDDDVQTLPAPAALDEEVKPSKIHSSDLTSQTVASISDEPSSSLVSPVTSNPSTAKKPRVSDIDDWLQDIVCLGESHQAREDITEQEVNRYLAAAQTDTDLTILEWWKKNAIFYPRLSILAKKYLSIPASSVSSERVFSLAGHLVNKKRARMSPSNIDMLIFLNKNMELYWK